MTVLHVDWTAAWPGGEDEGGGVYHFDWTASGGSGGGSGSAGGFLASGFRVAGFKVAAMKTTGLKFLGSLVFAIKSSVKYFEISSRECV